MTGKTSHGFLPNGLWRPGAFSSEALNGRREETNPEATRPADRSTALAINGGPRPMGRQYARVQISGSKKWGGAARGGDSTAPDRRQGDPAARTRMFRRLSSRGRRPRDLY